LNLEAPIWSDDKELKKQDCVKILTTSEVIDIIE